MNHTFCQSCGMPIDAPALRGTERGFVDADGDGVCDYHGAGCGTGFVDADGDGVCDHYGTGLGGHHGSGHGGCWNR